jgi:hypothetical protein
MKKDTLMTADSHRERERGWTRIFSGKHSKYVSALIKHIIQPNAENNHEKMARDDADPG